MIENIVEEIIEEIVAEIVAEINAVDKTKINDRINYRWIFPMTMTGCGIASLVISIRETEVTL